MWPRFEFPGLPQFLNQEPPRPQQLLFPDFPMVLHLRHTGLRVAAVVAAGILYVGIRQRNEQENAYQPLFSHAVTCRWR